MRARPNPFERQYKKGGLYSYDGPREETEPTESQIKVARAIAERLGINLPEVFTKKAYMQFISNHSGNKGDHRRARNVRREK